MEDRKQIDPRRPIPTSGYNRLRENMESNFREDFPVVGGSFPGPDNRASVNRANQVSRKDDKQADVSIGLQDHDEAIMYYFNNVIKPSVIINGNRTNVPVMYGAPERWKSVQKDGYFRDKEGKIQVPLIMFKRDNIEKRRDLGNKLDANNPQLYYTFQKKFTQRNQYDNFTVLQNQLPQKEMYKVIVPDFVKLTYTCTVWCDYIAQMNKLIEMINYSSDTYWGDSTKFHFNAKIDSYSNTTEVNQGDNRIVKTDFGLTVQGYLVPDSINKELASGGVRKAFSRSKIIFNTETVSSPLNPPARTREEVRNEPLGTNIDTEVTTDGGVAYQIIGNNNQIG